MQTSSPPRSLSPLARRIRAVLWDWDPIGVRAIGAGWPEDEYDDLLLPLMAALAERPSVEELADDLRTVLETDYGLPSPDGCAEAARALLAVRRED
ncbi:MAG: hypothetical protein BGO45_03210 [Microbacterium sp. 71-36]|uniref:hypothetical protein n=1 Tax=unclassified Microbacterium TaxID=2609290 RepID=UPI00086853EC|nr:MULTISPECIES: hypothetical protein [unclassified Microbacterium]MBN9209989.1 hypothetical protein [Microbacterium sp.]ODT39135.1 MAG: hypothetical protein ABS60_07520 [Microbacterium sp. SCN 71-17]ODU51544.1 MAG: hypothetical protein ABT07_02350 [Microbacterium sp. SCN 70-10]OJV74788.1 MAG: hypothetical protein BGO45_03210 [Microbacterium sp. 71-36]